MLLNFFLAYSTATDSTIDDNKEAQIRSTVNQIMKFIENEIKNQTIEQGSLSKRNYGFHPNFLKQYYPRAYGIVKSGCDENNPYLYRPAPAGGFYPPAVSAVYKREEAVVDHQVDGITENAKIIQKQLAVEWGTISNSDHTLARRMTLAKGVGEVAESLGRGVRTSSNDGSSFTSTSSDNLQNLRNTKHPNDKTPSSRSIDENAKKAAGSKNWVQITGLVGVVIAASFFILWLLRALFAPRGYIVPPPVPPFSVSGAIPPTYPPPYSSPYTRPTYGYTYGGSFSDPDKYVYYG